MINFVKSKLYFYCTCRKSIKGRGNQIINKNAFLKKPSFFIKGNNNLLVFEDGAKIYSTKFLIDGDNNKILIKANCKIDGGVIQIKSNNCVISTGEGTTSGGNYFLVNEPQKKITIGKDCMLSHDIEIRCGDSHSIICRKTKRRINYGEDVTIGNHVWIGTSAKILKGAIMQDNCIVGMRSIVTGVVKKDTIVVGSPAREIRQNITWTRERYNEDEFISDESLWQDVKNE